MNTEIGKVYNVWKLSMSLVILKKFTDASKKRMNKKFCIVVAE